MVTLSNDILALLAEYKKYQIEWLLKTGIRNEHNAVFLSTKGTLYTPNNVLRHLKRICTKANITVINIHSLRHLHVSWLLAEKVDPKTVQDRLGHANIQTTLDIYAHLMEETKKEAAEKASSRLQRITIADQ